MKVHEMITFYLPSELTFGFDEINYTNGSLDQMIFGRGDTDILSNLAQPVPGQTVTDELWFLGGQGDDVYRAATGTVTIVQETGDDPFDQFYFRIDQGRPVNLTATEIDAGDQRHLAIQDTTNGQLVFFVDYDNTDNRIESFAFESFDPATQTFLGTTFLTFDQFLTAALDETPIGPQPIPATDGRNPDFLGTVTMEEFFGSAEFADAFENNIDVADQVDFSLRDAKTIAYFYEVSFARAPDVEGLNFWIDLREEYARSFGERGLTEKEIANLFIESREFRNNVINPDTASDEDFTDVLYSNFLQRQSDAAGLNFWSGLLTNDPNFDRADLLIEFATSDELRSTPFRFPAIETQLQDYNPGYQTLPTDQVVQSPTEDWGF